MDIAKMKKNLEIFSLFMEYQNEFLEWAEKNKDNVDACHSYVDKWNGSDYTIAEECDCIGEKKDLPIIEFRIMFCFSGRNIPMLRILHNGNEVFYFLLSENRMEFHIKDIHNIEGV